VEHYEISGYGTARTMANLLGLDDVADLLEETLGEEEEADKLLSQIAMDQVNPQAIALGNGEMEGDMESADGEEQEEMEPPSRRGKSSSRRR
jgi:uncharacterized protein DUF892